MPRLHMLMSIEHILPVRDLERILLIVNTFRGSSSNLPPRPSLPLGELPE